MKKINKIKKIKLFLIFLLTVALMLSFTLFSFGCSKPVAGKTDASLSGAQTNQSGNNTENQAASESSSSSASTTVEETTTSEQISSDIKDMIAKADAYFTGGQFAEAVSAYRSIKTAVEKNTSSSDSLKQEIIASYTNNFEDSKTITDTARMHYGNAMQLEYEKRINEAIKELEAALSIYPKYQDAIDKLASIKSLYKLK